MCSKFGKFLAKVESEKSVTLYRGSCKQWSCPECSQKLRQKWRSFLAEKVDNLMSNGKVWHFITITAPSYKKTPFLGQLGLSDKLFKTQWNNLMQFLRDQNGGAFNYVRVLEIQKRGAIHAHMICDVSFPIDDVVKIKRGVNAGKSYSIGLKKRAIALGFGHQVNTEPLQKNGLGVAGYITKYISKESRQYESWLPEGTRYIQTSRSIGALPKYKTDDDWMIVAPSGVAGLLKRGFLVSDGDKKNEVITWFDLVDGVYEI